MIGGIGMRDLLGAGIGGFSGLALGTLGTGLLMLFFVILVWNLVWKGLALWKAARKSHLAWFIVFLIVNTLGILEILYIFIFSEFEIRKKKAKKTR